MTTHTAITDYYAGAELDDESLLCHRTTDATVYTASTTGEVSTGGSVFAAVFSNVAAGRYRLKLLADGEVVATRDVQFAGTPNEVVETGVKAELDSAITDQIDAIEAKTTNLPSDPADQSVIIAAIDAMSADLASLESVLQGASVVQVASPNVSGNLVLTQGDTYDGATGGNPKASWTVSTDYTDGWSVAFTIRDENDVEVYETTGTVVSATVVAVAITTPTGLTMEGCPGQWQGKFDVQLTKAGSIKTIALGVCYINEDQTR